MELTMANGRIPWSYSTINPCLFHGFAPFSTHKLNTNKKKNQISKISTAGGPEAVLHKQFEFEPSFDHYLKAMETLKTATKETTPIKDSYPNSTETSKHKYARREDGQPLKSSKQGKGYSHNAQKVATKSSNGVPKSNFGMEKTHRLVKGNGTTRGSVRGNLEYNDNYQDLTAEWELGDSDDDDEVDASVNKTNGRTTNAFSSHSRITKDKMHRRSYREKNASSDDDLNRRGFEEKSEYTNAQKNTRTSNSTHLSNTERVTNFTGVSRWTPERKQSYDTSIRSATSESSLDRTLSEWKRTSTSGSKVELGQIQIWKNKSTTQTSEVDRQIHSHSFNEKKSSYAIEKNATSNWKVPKRESPGYQSSNEHLELDRGYRRTEKTKSIKSGNFAKGTKFSEEEDDEGDMEMERAAFKSFEVFTDLRGQPRVLRMEMEERIQNLAKWLNGTDINLPEWLFSKMIHSAQIKFSDHSILRVIQILGTFGNWRRVLQVIEWLESRERFKSYKSRYIYTTALDVLGKAKRPVEALNVFHAMRKGMSSYPDLAAYHCIAVTLGQAGYVKELFDVIDCMRSPPPTKFNTGYIEKWDPRLEPDIIIYNAVLNACARRKQWEGAFWVLQQLKEQGLQPSSTTYGLVMEVMFACEKYNLVYDFFRKVQKSTIPNTLNYKVLVNTLWKEGKTDDAVFAVKDMERRGIVGSASLYYDLARCLCSAGRCQEALMQMDTICKVARKPLVVTYTGLIQACLDAGNVQDGTYIFKQMQAFCSPNLVTFNIMLKAYTGHGMFEDAKDLFQKMLDESCHITRRSDYKHIVTPDSYTFNTMLDACAAEQKWDDFQYIFQEMLHRGYNFNTRRHLRMVLDSCRAGKGEVLEMTWKHMIQANRVPPPPLIKEMFCMKLEKNDYTAAITSITSHPTNDLLLHAFSEKGWLDLLNASTDRLQKDTVISLTHKLNSSVAGSDRPHPVLQNLIYSCKEFIQAHSIADVT